jgi:hypothetical protein
MMYKNMTTTSPLTHNTLVFSASEPSQKSWITKKLIPAVKKVIPVVQKVGIVAGKVATIASVL